MITRAEPLKETIVYGLSTDNKDEFKKNALIFFEMDTGIAKIYDADNDMWRQL